MNATAAVARSGIVASDSTSDLRERLSVFQVKKGSGKAFKPNPLTSNW